MKNVLALKINDISQVSEARRLTSYALTAMGFSENEIGKVSIIVTELTSNLVKHTPHGGEFHLYELETENYKGVEILSIDKGPGMKNIAQSMRDGYSTSSSPGTGLGSVNRLSDFFDIYSQPDSGTIILSRVWLKKNQSKPFSEYFELSTIHRPKANEEVSGDKWLCIQEGHKARMIAADGLGHGIYASEAALEAIKSFEENINLPPDKIIHYMNMRMNYTRGAAIAVLEIDASNLSLLYCGVGNISACLLTPSGSKNLLSHNGIVGREIKRIQPLTYSWTDDSLLIVHSDGISARWNLEKYPGLFFKSLTIICAIIYRDFCRGNDDTMIIAMRKR